MEGEISDHLVSREDEEELNDGRVDESMGGWINQAIDGNGSERRLNRSVVVGKRMESW